MKTKIYISVFIGLLICIAGCGKFQKWDYRLAIVNEGSKRLDLEPFTFLSGVKDFEFGEIQAGGVKSMHSFRGFPKSNILFKWIDDSGGAGQASALVTPSNEVRADNLIELQIKIDPAKKEARVIYVVEDRSGGKRELQ